MKKYLTIAAMTLFVLGFLIADAYIKITGNLERGWDWRMIIISIYTILLLIANISPYKPYEISQIKLITIVSIGLLVVDIAHKYTNHNHFTISDVVFFVAITFSASLFIYPNFRTNLWELILKKLKR